jgi:hypothetical protein
VESRSQELCVVLTLGIESRASIEFQKAEKFLAESEKEFK